MQNSEKDLIIRLQSHDEGAFVDLYDQFSSALFGIILKIVANTEDAESLLQDTFVKIWKNINSYDASKGRLFTWMLNIARNTAINHIRSPKNNPYLEIQKADLNVYFTGNVEAEEFLIKAEVQKMDESLREVIELIYYWGYTQQETSDKLGLPLGTVKTRTRTALTYLRNKFGAYE